MFTGELAESRQTEVVIRDIDERAMELLIDFAYTSQVTTQGFHKTESFKNNKEEETEAECYLLTFVLSWCIMQYLMYIWKGKTIFCLVV